MHPLKYAKSLPIHIQLGILAILVLGHFIWVSAAELAETWGLTNRGCFSGMVTCDTKAECDDSQAVSQLNVASRDGVSECLAKKRRVFWTRSEPFVFALIYAPVSGSTNMYKWREINSNHEFFVATHCQGWTRGAVRQMQRATALSHGFSRSLPKLFCIEMRTRGDAGSHELNGFPRDFVSKQSESPHHAYKKASEPVCSYP